MVSAATWGAGQVVVLGHQNFWLNHLANVLMDSPLGLFNRALFKTGKALFAGRWLQLHAWQCPAAQHAMHVHVACKTRCGRRCVLVAASSRRQPAAGL